MGTCQFRSKQNADWGRTKKPSRPTLLISYATQKQENILCHKKKKPSPASERFKKKNQSGLFHHRCRLLTFLFNPWMIFAWCWLGNVRSASSGDASILDLDRSSLHADVSYHFFDQFSWMMFFLCRGGLTLSWPTKWEHASVGRIIIGWCRLGNVRSASSGEASSLDLRDQSSFLADVDCHFFRSISVNNIFLPWWANVFLAE